MSVAYASAPEKVVAVLRAVAQGHPQVLKDPAPQALLIAFGDSAIDSELRAWSAPNVVIVLIDDMGFGQPSTFGVKRKATTASPVASTGSRSR